MKKLAVGQKGLMQYIQMANRAKQPDVAHAILDQHFGKMDTLQRLKSMVPKPVAPAVLGRATAMRQYGLA